MIIDGQKFSSMVISAANMLDNNKAAINKMNVFPVPDGDTGINMTLTLRSVRSLESFDGSISDCAEKIASQALRSARGNSGAILSLYFRGVSKGLKGLEYATAADLAEALRRGTEEAYKAVMKPTEGTILTVMRASSEEAARAVKNGLGDDPAALFTRVLDAAQTALEKTPELLPVLKEANVVDAGGCGFVCVISGMVEALNLNPVIAEHTDFTEAPAEADFSDFDTESIVNTYCTECIVSKTEEFYGEEHAESLHQFLPTIGDSLVFVETEDIIKLHVHTNHPGTVLEEALKFGQFEMVKIENMKNQHTALLKLKPDFSDDPEPAAPEKEFGFVSVCMGEGIHDTFIDLGVDTVIAGGQTMNPSTQDIIDGVNRTPSRVVYVLPNNKNIIMVAEQAASLVEDKKVVVLHTRSVPEGISAMIAFNPDGDEASNTEGMAEAIHAVHTAQTTYAVRDTTIDGMEIRNGQTLALADGKIIRAADTEEDAIRAIGEAFPEASFITMFYGTEITQEQADAAAEILRSQVDPTAEITVISGGQPIYNYIISVE